MAKSSNKPTKKAVKPAVNAEEPANIPAKPAKKANQPVVEAVREKPIKPAKPASKAVTAAPKAQKILKKAAPNAKKKTAGAKKPKRHRKAKRPTTAELLKIAERRNLVWDLYKAGASYRAISEHLKIKGFDTASIGTVHSDLKYCLSLQHTELDLDVKDHIENEVAVINEVQLTFYPVMKDAKIPLDLRMNASDRVMGCVKERAKLRNLYKPPKLNLSVDDELAKILGIAPEMLPDVRNPEDK